jgi:hypothetical protein
MVPSNGEREPQWLARTRHTVVSIHKAIIRSDKETPICAGRDISATGRDLAQMSRVFGFDQFAGQSLNFTSSHNCSDNDCPKERHPMARAP